MSFALISSIIAFMEVSVYCVAIWYYRIYSFCVRVRINSFPFNNRAYYNYNNYNYNCTCSWMAYRYKCSTSETTTGIALYVVLVIAMIAEFGISLAVAIYCCKHGCGCCANSTGVSSTYFICLLQEATASPIIF